MKPRSDIHQRLATSLRDTRKARGLSLEAVANLSGVSRLVVSQIARGESSPTVATPWNLTQAPQVDFAGLLEGKPASGIEVIRAAAVPVSIGRGEGVRIRILSPGEAVGGHEVHALRFAPARRPERTAQSPGCREHLTVIKGGVLVMSGAAEDRLGPGDTARHRADHAHSIRSDGGAARAILIARGS